MELGVVLLLADEARAAGLDPARDPIPGLRRDVLFTCTADEEAGGLAGRAWIAENRPEWLPRGGRDQRVRRRLDDGRRAAALPDPGRREGLRRLPDPRPRDVGPRLDAARGQRRASWPPRSSRASPRPDPTRLTPVMSRFLDVAADALPAEAGRGRSRRSRPATRRAAEAALDGALRPDVRARPAGAAPRHDQPGRRPRRRQVQRHPRRRRRRGRLPGPARARPSRTMRAELDRAARARTWRRACDIELDRLGRAGRGAGRRRALRPPGGDHPRPRPGRRSRCRSWSRSRPTPSTRPTLGVPTYGFSPLRLDPDERFLERFHGVDERVSRRRAALGPAGPVRRGPPLLRLTPRRSAASGAARGQSGALRSTADHDLLVAGRAAVDRARPPNPAPES